MYAIVVGFDWIVKASMAFVHAIDNRKIRKLPSFIFMVAIEIKNALVLCQQ